MQRFKTLVLTATMAAGCFASLPTCAWGYIERLLPLQELLDDSDVIFVARVERVDPDKPSAVLVWTKDLKGKCPFPRLAINLTGDQEKHTPQLLKRIAADVPLVLFVTEQNKKQIALGFVNGTWLQFLGEPDGVNVRWRFTHCEIYLRRTFKGTTEDLEKTVADALSGKRPPPPVDAKEKPGFGPELEPAAKKPGASRGAGGTVLLGVIALPFLLPIAALVQLLFPGMLRDQWRQYQVATGVLLTQSTLIAVHFALVRWLVAEPQRFWWLGERTLWVAMLAVAVLGLAVAAWRSLTGKSPSLARPPVRVEYLALGTLFVAGVCYVFWQTWRQANWLDEMAVLTAAATLGGLHLLYRRWRYPALADARAIVTTELVFLTGLVATGSALGYFLHQPAVDNQLAAEVTHDWPTHRGNSARTGTLDDADEGPRRPQLLWTFDPGVRKGRLAMHSSPVVVDDQLYVGAFHQLLSLSQGFLYCVDARTGLVVDAKVVSRQPIWQFSARDTLRPVFSSPIVANGRVYFGEGYHQDTGCRLFCVDAANAATVHWAIKTTSHVESSPTVAGTRVYFGAGDDGLWCVDEAEIAGGADGDWPTPRVAWRINGIHVDAAPVVVDGRVMCGSTTGDRFQELAALAVDAASGVELWRTPAPLPITGSPAAAEGRIFFGLGNGKLGQDADRPAGAVWCLDAATGRRLWTHPTGNGVMGSPVAFDASILAATLDGMAIRLRAIDGRLEWEASLPGPVAASPVVAGGKAYFLTTAGALICLRVEDGRVLWQFDGARTTSNDAYASPVLHKSRLFLAVGGKVHCIGDGAE